jgi:hypothetical protein
VSKMKQRIVGRLYHSQGWLALIDVQIRQVQCSRELDAGFNDRSGPNSFERRPVHLELS